MKPSILLGKTPQKPPFGITKPVSIPFTTEFNSMKKNPNGIVPFLS